MLTKYAGAGAYAFMLRGCSSASEHKSNSESRYQHLNLVSNQQLFAYDKVTHLLFLTEHPNIAGKN